MQILRDLDLDNSKVKELWSHAISITTLYKQKLTIIMNKSNQVADKDSKKNILKLMNNVVQEAIFMESHKCICFKDTADLKISLSENEKL